MRVPKLEPPMDIQKIHDLLISQVSKRKPSEERPKVHTLDIELSRRKPSEERPKDHTYVAFFLCPGTLVLLDIQI